MVRPGAVALCALLLPLSVAAARAEGECPAVPVVALDGDASFANLQTLTPIPLRSGAPVARYEINARLDTHARTIRAGQRLHWRNRSEVPVCTLYLHQDLNAFEGLATRHADALRRRGQVPRVGRGEWGYSQITRLRQDGQEARWSYVQPGAAPAAERSVVRVDLPSPVAPGATATLEIGFVARLPGAWAQSGHADGFFFAGRWFPQVATLQLPGERGAPELRWTAPALAGDPVERERGDFDVHLDVPHDHVAVSSGQARSVTRSRDGRRHYHFVQRDAATLAWAADPQYFAQPLEYPFVSGEGKAVTVRVFYRPGQAATAIGTLGMLAEALAQYTAALGGYPDATVTAVIAPAGSGTLATQAHAGLLAAAASTRSAYTDAALRRHVFASIGARYLPDGTDAAFRDGVERYWIERFTRGRDATTTARGNRWFHRLLAPWQGVASALRAQWRVGRDPDGERASHIAKVLHDLEARIGTEAIDRGFRAWRRSARAAFPDTGQVRWVVADGSGHAQAFQQAFDIIDSGLRVDDRIAAFSSEELLPQPGYALDGGARIEMGAAEVRRMIRHARGQARRGAGPYPYRTEVVVRRDGAFVPQVLGVRFADGSTREIQWDDRRNPVRFEWTTPTRAVAVQLDPRRQVRIDRSKLDDGRTLDGDPAAARRWSEEIAGFVQLAASWVAML